MLLTAENKDKETPMYLIMVGWGKVKLPTVTSSHSILVYSLSVKFEVGLEIYYVTIIKSHWLSSWIFNYFF